MLAVLATLAGLLLLRDTAAFGAIEGQTLSIRFHLRGPLPQPAEVAVVAIDDRSISALRGWPIRRSLLAQAIDRIHDAGASAVGLDLLLIDPEPDGRDAELSNGDRQLIESLRRAGNGVLSVALAFGDIHAPLDASTREDLRKSAYRVVLLPADAGQQRPFVASGALLPFPALRASAGIAHVNVLLEGDGGLRHFSAAIRLGEFHMPGLPVELTRRVLGVSPDEMALRVGDSLVLGERRVSLDAAGRIALNYYGGNRAIATYSLADLLQDRVPPGALRGRAVLVGATALGLGDTFPTPFSGALAGVEVLATATANILGQRALRADGLTLLCSGLAILALGGIAYRLGAIGQPALAAASIGVLFAFWFALLQVAFMQWQLWINATFPTIALFTVGAISATSRAMQERRLRAEIDRQRRNLSSYHSPLIADLLAKSAGPTEEHEQMAAILFVDMQGFTGRMEGMPPAEAAHFLREFHTRIERAAVDHAGLLEHFSGDGAMVIFGMPNPADGDASNALACARALQEEVASWNHDLAREGKMPIRIGIGIHHGPVIIARLGSERHRHLTAAGDTVNVASRLEALTRILDAAIVLSGDAVARIRAAGDGERLAGFSRLPAQPIRGRSGRIDIWLAKT